MQSDDLPRAEKILNDLAHDLRQSLGTIEVSAYILNQSLAGTNEQTQSHARTIERQVEAASEALVEAVAAMRRLCEADGQNRALTKSATAGLR